jgi:hypothetical protein
MSSPETFIAFAAIMFVIALIGAAIDWFGTPLRHRKFIPKAYRFPDERLFRNEKLHNSNLTHFQKNLDDSAFLGSVESAPERVPEPSPQNNDFLVEQEDPNLINVLSSTSTLNDESAPVDTPDVELIDGTDPMKIVLIDNDNQQKDPPSRELEEPLPVGLQVVTKGSETFRLRGWTPGGYIFNLTHDGREPSPATVRTRYWKNVGAEAGSAIFGTANIERMCDGKPPQRRNYRTGKLETMRITPISFQESSGEIPIPYWPSTAVDPFVNGK